ncbi:universal stress protein [Bacillus taeanensis]|uniref:Universal stress protein n=1 Tax=Bacillus taeanensis TaxID=273032 RepID=A0A366XYM1_9BACI|nr:universal stress protein [Bacillus taeanensis]RBW70668.1 universal stress protein [Bacillus taeanensis]
MYQKIVAAFDGSEGSVKALEHAIELSKRQSAKLTVVHVVKEKNLQTRKNEPKLARSNEIFTPYGYAPNRDDYGVMNERELIEEERMRITENNDEILVEAKAKIAEKHIPAKFDVLEGDPAKRLCEYADIHQADVIVIGSRGISGLKKLMIGSVSEKVAKEAEVPVLIVK